MKSKLKYFIFGFLNFRQALSFLFLKQEHISKAQKYLDELKRIHLNGCRITRIIYGLHPVAISGHDRTLKRMAFRQELD